MSFPRYPSYKEIGVEWLGEVPAHWAVVPLKHVIQRIESGTSVNAVDNPATEGERGVLKTSCVYSGEFNAAENKAILPEEYDRASCPLRAGTLIVSRMNTPDLVGAAGLVRVEAEELYLPDRLWQLHLKNCEPAFVHFWTASAAYRSQVQMACSGTSSSMQNLAQDQLRTFCFPNPPQREQAEIVVFLQCETAKIDALVLEQQRLIELLKEKRQAVISHSVTKGLDPNARMKVSGVEWLGEVPEHWECRSISSISTKITNGYVGPTRDVLVDEGVRYLQSLHIKNNSICFDSPYFVRHEWSMEHSKSILNAGDVLIVQTGDIGQVAVVTDEFAGCNCHALIIVAPVKNVISGEWLSWTLNSDYGFHTLLSIQTGALHPHLNCGNVKAMIVPVPPLEEQQEIVATLERRVKEFDALISEAQAGILLLQERRAALISAAVTGKIDVRGLVEANESAAEVVAA